MILSKTVEITISNNGAYYRARGYGECKQRDVITVRIEDLTPGCNKRVECQCTKCSSVFSRKFNTINVSEPIVCHSCSYSKDSRRTTKIKRSSANSSIPRKHGPDHHRFKNFDSYELMYDKSVANLTQSVYRKFKNLINPGDLPLGRAGSRDAYQIDHIISKSYGRDNRIDHRIICHPCNLRVIRWEDNLEKSDKNALSLDELMVLIENSGVCTTDLSSHNIDHLLSEDAASKKERLRKTASLAGKKGGAVNRDNCLGMFSLTREQRVNNSSMAGLAYLEKYGVERLRDIAMMGGAARARQLSENAHITSSFYNDGRVERRFSYERNRPELFEQFLSENPQYARGRLYKKR